MEIKIERLILRESGETGAERRNKLLIGWSRLKFCTEANRYKNFCNEAIGSCRNTG
ncbi:hypothetical protein SD427_14030 [Chryseobacterium sp. JJR-5R]|uniref:hypothetical protein n=1 Tax=Chryseobacterium sp. JJR-5R TaxID=3093923 RepID=UPI002A75FE07|nr:hypothetical protein [Chryseobacterium sp. JJR-5R]WPO81879.1 hypothetical protein SD427_14030 [Chryseobacterium sp. JJR-5R]